MTMSCLGAKQTALLVQYTSSVESFLYQFSIDSFPVSPLFFPVVVDRFSVSVLSSFVFADSPTLPRPVCRCAPPGTTAVSAPSRAPRWPPRTSPVLPSSSVRFPSPCHTSSWILLLLFVMYSLTCHPLRIRRCSTLTVINNPK